MHSSVCPQEGSTVKMILCVMVIHSRVLPQEGLTSLNQGPQPLGSGPLSVAQAAKFA